MSASSSERLQQVGLDRIVRLEWLQRTASLVMAGSDATATKAALQEILRPSFRSAALDVRGSLDKTITILQKTWGNPPSELRVLHDEGLDLLRRLPSVDHFPVHWGMIAAVYPFWSSVAIQVGRLFTLQGSAAASHVQRRIREQYGERETVARRARYVLRSFVDWGALVEAGIKGVYQAAPERSVTDLPLTAWLIQSSLHTRASAAAPLRELLHNHALFPLRLPSISSERLASIAPRLEIIRHGLDEDLVVLRR